PLTLNSTLRIFVPLASDAGPDDRRVCDDAHGLFDGSCSASKGAERRPSFFPEGPIEDVDEIVASDGTQASDGNAGFSMNEREAAIAPFDRHGTGVEIEGFDKLDDVVISHAAIVPDRRVAVLVWPRTGPIRNAAA